MLPVGGTYLHVLNSGWQSYFSGWRFRKILYPAVMVTHTLLRLGMSAVGLSGLNYAFMVVQPSGEDLALISRLLEERRCVPLIDSVVPLSAKGLAEAHDKSEAGHCRGKIVLLVGEGGANL